MRLKNGSFRRNNQQNSNFQAYDFFPIAKVYHKMHLLKIKI